MKNSTSERIKAEAVRLGFDAVGICAANACPETGERLRDFIHRGFHGDMLWLEARMTERGSPTGLWPEVRSVIVLGLSYAPMLDPLRHADALETGVISVYALGKDYHDILKRKLKLLGGWLAGQHGGALKVFVDTAPVMEKPLAQAAGLGWQGKHSNLVSRKNGSWLFLGAIYTTLDLAADTHHADSCGSCTACQTACPTNAFVAPYQLDARRCISYLTIEHKGPIPRDYRVAMANRIYGCDDCLAVCPWNKFAVASRESAFTPRAELVAPKLIELAALDDAGFRTMFAGSPIKRLGRDRFIRNVLIALGNSGASKHEDDPRIKLIATLLRDPNALVRGAAIWALGRIASPSIFHCAFNENAATEPDAEVRTEWQLSYAESGRDKPFPDPATLSA